MVVKLAPLALDLDGSIIGQVALCARLEAVVPLEMLGEKMRIWADAGVLKDIRERLTPLREQYHAPWVTFLGSGDYHHMTLVLMESLPVNQRPTVLVVVDNHPDWFLESPPYHCGNWVGTALATLGWLKQIILIGVDSNDFQGYRFWRAPWDDLCRGRLRVYPYRNSKVTIPFRGLTPGTSPVGARKTWRGVDWSFRNLVSSGVESAFRDIAVALRGESVYLSIDKDCLRRDQLITDWEQGGLLTGELLSGVRHISGNVHLCGVDICGEQAVSPLRDWAKRLDTGRWIPKGRSPSMVQEAQAHERVNLALLDALETGNQERNP